MKQTALDRRDLFGVREPGRLTVQAQIQLANGIEKAQRFAEVDDGFWNEESAQAPSGVTHHVKKFKALTPEGESYVNEK